MRIPAPSFVGLVFVFSMLAMASSAAERRTLAIGSPAPDFRLPGADGKDYSLADFAGAKILAVIFTSNHCPTAQAYEERIKQLVRDYANKGVAVVAINPNHAPAVRFDELGYTDLGDTLDEMMIRASHREFNFPYLDDGPEQTVSDAYGPIATPHVFVFDAERRLRFQGRIDNAEREDLVDTRDTRAAIDALLAGRVPEVAETRVFGCSVKWKEKAEDNARWMARVRREEVALSPADAATLSSLMKNDSGKVRMINVWATWCGPCVSEFDELIETNLRFRQRDFELVTVAAEYPDQHAKVLRFLQRHHASTRNLIFGDTDKYKMIEALDPEWTGALPYTLLLAPDGTVLYRETGSLNFLELRRKIVPAVEAISPWPAMSGPG